MHGPSWILGGFFTLGFSGERFVIHRHCSHPSHTREVLAAECLEGKGRAVVHVFFSSSRCLSPCFLESEPLGKCLGQCFLDAFGVCVWKRGPSFADSPGVGPAMLRCGLIRGKQSFNYL